MSVYDDLTQIMSARYGKDVRQAIHDAIAQCYSDATGNPESVAALVQDILEIKSEISAMKENRSWIGKIIVDSELDTEEKVIAKYGGTHWTKLEGRALVGADSTHEVDSEFGSSTVALTEANIPLHYHTYEYADETDGTILGINDIPAHTHSLAFPQSMTGGTNVVVNASGSGIASANNIITSSAGGSQPHSHTISTEEANTSSVGSGQAFDIIPPSIAVYIWKRTA